MRLDLLQTALDEIKGDLDLAITTASYRGKTWPNGLEAKQALIRSVTLIQRIHEVTKISLDEELKKRNLAFTIHPPVGKPSPELTVWGRLKKKKQDIVALRSDFPPLQELIHEGPMKNSSDMLGRVATEHSIVIGVRSQLSSVNKNFDTLMERAFAETTNLRLRHPRLVMGEVYLLAVKDYDDGKMKKNRVEWKTAFTKIERFISIFNGMSGRLDPGEVQDAYRYEQSALIFADFSRSPVKLYTTRSELVNDGLISTSFEEPYDETLSPRGFIERLVTSYLERHAADDRECPRIVIDATSW